MLPPKEKRPSCPATQRVVEDDGKAKIGDLVRALLTIASGDVSLAGLVRVTARFEGGNLSVVAYQQGVHNGSNSWAFTGADLAALGSGGGGT